MSGRKHIQHYGADTAPTSVNFTATTGDTAIVAAQAGKRIVVHALSLCFADAGTITIETDDGDSTQAAISGVYRGAATGATIVLPWNPQGWFSTEVGDLLNALVATAASVSGDLTYTLQD